MKFSKDFTKIRGDASLREFYRNHKNKTIIIFAKKEKNKNLLIYDAINKILIKNNIIAPQLVSQNYLKNYIEVEDLGTKSIYQLLNNKKTNNYLILVEVLKVLKSIQLIKDKKIKNFKKKSYQIKKYKNNILFNEAKLFCDWYVPKKLPKKKYISFNFKFKKEIRYLLSKLNYKNDTFVHRDFHVSNLVVNLNKKIGVIDSQDALIGNKAYDLASLIDDVRFKTSISLKNKVYNHYVNSNKKINEKKFKNDFEILSVLRNLKIIGIFTRLALRDNKAKYLKLIPYAWEMINFRMKQNKVFVNLNFLLKDNFRSILGK